MTASTASTAAVSSPSAKHLKRLSLSSPNASAPPPSSAISPSSARIANSLDEYTTQRAERLQHRLATIDANAQASSLDSSSDRVATSSASFVSPTSSRTRSSFEASRQNSTPGSTGRSTARNRPQVSTTSNGHVRRSSSISYAMSPDAWSSTSSPPNGQNGVPPGAATSPTLNRSTGRFASYMLPVTSGESQIAGSTMSSTSNEAQENDMAVRDSRTASIAAATAASAQRIQSPMKTSSKSSLGNTMPTLTEANADLLSFIAKKERKCLDLREELHRHEEELRQLKKKWEAIVAKSLLSHDPPTTTSMPRPSSSPEMKRSALFARHGLSTSQSREHGSPALSTRPIPLHALDLGLLSSTFDVEPDDNIDTSHSSGSRQRGGRTHARSKSSGGSGGFDSPDLELHSGNDRDAEHDLELSESVQAAKAWVGGVFGKVMEAAASVGGGNAVEHQQSSLQIQQHSQERQPLDVLREEEEDEGANETDSPAARADDGRKTASSFKATPRLSVGSNASASEYGGGESDFGSGGDRGAKRRSKASSASISSASSFGFSNGVHGSGSESESLDSEVTVKVASSVSGSDARHSTNQCPEGTLATAGQQDTGEGQVRPITASTGTISSRTRAPPSSTSERANAIPPSASAGHARSRSTFDMFSGGWSSFNKRLNAVALSETFQNSKRATLDLVDTFENGLAAALGPLEPPPLSPPQPQAALVTSLSSSSSSPPPSSSSSSSSAAAAGTGTGTSKKLSGGAPSKSQGRNNQGQQHWDWSSFLDGSEAGQAQRRTEAPREVSTVEKRQGAN